MLTFEQLRARIDWSKPAWPTHGKTAEQLRAELPPSMEPKVRRALKEAADGVVAQRADNRQTLGGFD